MGPVDVMAHKVEVLQGPLRRRRAGHRRDRVHARRSRPTIRDIEGRGGAGLRRGDGRTTGRPMPTSPTTTRSGRARPSRSPTGCGRTSSSASDGHLRAAGAVRRRDARAVHRRGEAAHRRRLSRRAPAVSRATDSRIARASSARRQARRVADRGVVEGVADDRVDRRVVGEAERAQGRALADVAQQLVDGADRSRPAAVASGLGRRSRRRARSRPAPARGRASRGRTRGPRAGPPRAPSRGRPDRASRSRARARGPARRPCRSPGRRPPGARPCSICDRASRSEPSATARRSHVPTVRTTPIAIASANGFGFADRSDSSEWVIASIPVAAVTAGGRPTVRPGSRIVAIGSRLGMADVALAPGRLVGDDAEAVRLRAGPGGRRDRDDRAARAPGPAPSYSRSQTGRSLAARRSSALAVSIADPPPTGDHDRAGQPEVAQAPRAALDRGGARVRLDLGEDAGVDAGRLRARRGPCR